LDFDFAIAIYFRRILPGAQGPKIARKQAVLQLSDKKFAKSSCFSRVAQQFEIEQLWREAHFYRVWPMLLKLCVYIASTLNSCHKAATAGRGEFYLGFLNSATNGRGFVVLAARFYFFGFSVSLYPE
jgi:hypothetical protein